MSNRIENFIIVFAGPGAFCWLRTDEVETLLQKVNKDMGCKQQWAKPDWIEDASNRSVNTRKFFEWDGL